MIQLSGLWLSKDKNGKSYMVGYLGNAKILIYRNDYKTDSEEDARKPDYVLYVAEKQRPQADDNKTDDIPF